MITFASEIFNSLVLEFLIVLIFLLRDMIFKFISKWFVWPLLGMRRKFLIYTSVSYAAFSIPLWRNFIAIEVFLIFCLISTIVISLWLIQKIYNLGLIDAFSSTIKGINYERTLSRPNKSFDFLGVGANKLTSNDEFSAMIERCHNANQPIRLLLSDPDNPLIASQSQRHENNPDEYKTSINDSLRRIAKIVERKQINLQVRFYKHSSPRDFKQFRMVFLDSKICVVSVTVWDSSKGESNPQLILRNGHSNSVSRDLYSIFEDQFEKGWSDEFSTLVDLKTYL